MGKVLDCVNSPEDLKNLGIDDLKNLAAEIRECLVETVSRTGGHLASNLGVVELSIALHRTLNSPRDKIIWDVGHQSYVHKILTGRKNELPILRKRGGLSGFPKTSESKHDCFNTGHSSTSISAALGMAKARDIKQEQYAVVCVIGDGAMTAGMAFEALNDAGRSSTNLIVVLNDNEMAISRSVGGLSKYLSRIRTQPIYSRAREDIDQILKKIPAIGKSAARALDLAKGTIKYIVTPGILFEEMGFKYLGPIDGHNIEELINVLSRSRNLKGPVLIHVCTKKGKGYEFAEKNPNTFHGVPPFEIETGKVKTNNNEGYSKVFGSELLKCAEENDKLVAVSAAMPEGTGLKDFENRFGNRFFDVGIAEQHAVTFAAGIAANGLKPVVAIYSSFLQRAYDQILHDVALQGLDVVLAVDRAGIVGEDGETHQGIYDLSYMLHMPGLTVMAPSDYKELRKMLRYAIMKHKGPVAIRYPKGSGPRSLGLHPAIQRSRAVIMREGTDVTVVALGSMVAPCLKAAETMRETGISAEVINARFAKPIDMDTILCSVQKTKKLVTAEENVVPGGFGSEVVRMLTEKEVIIPFKILGISDKPVEHGSREELLKEQGLDAESIARRIVEFTGKGGVRS